MASGSERIIIGRAVRINSHADLLPEFRSVKVFMYLMTFSEKQLLGDQEEKLKKNANLRYLNDYRVEMLVNLMKMLLLLTDEASSEISSIKENVKKDILKEIF